MNLPSWEDYKMQVNCVTATVSLAHSFTNEVLTDLGWNYMRQLNRLKSSVCITFPASLLWDPAILPSFLLWSWYLSTSSLLQIQEINLLVDNIFLFLLDSFLSFSSDELLHKLKPSWIHSTVSHLADEDATMQKATWKCITLKAKT